MTLTFHVLPGRFAVVRLSPDAAVPPWVRGAFVSITRTAAELSIVCEEAQIPEGSGAIDRGWLCLQLQGPFALDETGVAAAFTRVLAEADVSVLVIATYDTDYLLIRESARTTAIAALRAAGHTVREPSDAS